MRAEGFCEKHGPYDASLGGCPYCAREIGQRVAPPSPAGRPAAPPPLDDELPTDPWAGRERSAYPSADEEETDLGSWSRRRGEAEDMTDLPERRRAGWDEEETVAEQAEEGLLGFLIVKEGMRRGQVHRIRGGTTLGRGDATLVVRDPKVSRPHARFTVESNQFVIWDFGSENGTLVNGERIRQATPLKENDVIKVGDTTFVLKTIE